MGNNQAKCHKTPEDAANDQRRTQSRQLILPDEQDAEYGDYQGNIFFARGSQDTGDEKPDVAFIGQRQQRVE